jgi:hypothetical protein
MGKTKTFTSAQISKEFKNLTKDKKIEILYEAIDIMQQYNGRSRFTCIALALGYENYEGESDTFIKEKN